MPIVDGECEQVTNIARQIVNGSMPGGIDRRDLLRFGAALFATSGPVVIRAESEVPKITHGVMAGDISGAAATIWSRADRPCRMFVAWRTSEKGNVTKVAGPALLENSDFTGRVQLNGLPRGQTIFYEVSLASMESKGAESNPVPGNFRTPPAGRERDVTFLWSGDTVGQGWGSNPDVGGMQIYDTMHKAAPDFFVHSGDTIYADGPLVAEVKLPNGTIWRNVVTEEKSKVAETLREFRGAYKYNLMDRNVQRFHAAVPQLWQWDDHEVMDNWSPGKDITANAKYTEKNVPLLVQRARQAFLEFAPIGFSKEGPKKIQRKIEYGPLLDVFVIDMRSYRGPNSFNRQSAESDVTAYLGSKQVQWLEESLRSSKAIWKVIASDMPIGLVVSDGKDEQGRPRFENSANGNGPALGRELEIARVLRFIKENKVHNVVWLTADVHYTAAHRYSPDRAQFKDFDPFWEFVSGPMNAGTFGPSPTDDTFGIEVVYQRAPEPGQFNLSPAAGMQFFGEVHISAKDQAMTVTLRDIRGTALFTQRLEPSSVRQALL